MRLDLVALKGAGCLNCSSGVGFCCILCAGQCCFLCVLHDVVSVGFNGGVRYVSDEGCVQVQRCWRLHCGAKKRAIPPLVKPGNPSGACKQESSQVLDWCCGVND